MQTAPDPEVPVTAAPAHDPAGVVSPWAPHLRLVTLGMVILIALNAFEALAVTTTMPAVVTALGGLELYALAFAAPVASGVVGMVLAGIWCDRRAPGPTVLSGVGLFVLGLGIAGTAPVMASVVTGRLVQGLGGGMLGVALYVVVARLYPDSAQPRVFAAFAAAWVLPSVVGPALAGAITEAVGWRWVFLSVPLLAAPALLVLGPALRSAGLAPPGRPAGASPGRRLALALGAGTGALVLHWAGQQGRVAALGAVLVGLVLLGLTVPGLLPAGTWRMARGLPTVIAIRGLVAGAFFGAEVFLPLLLITERGLSPAVAGLALTTAAVLWSTGSSIRGRQEGRWADGVVLRAGSAALALGIALAASAVGSGVPVAVGLVGWGFAGLGMGLMYPSLSLLTLRLSSVAEQGRNSSALQVSEALTVAVVLALSGALFTAMHGANAVGAAYLACFAVAAALAVLSALGAPRVGARRPGPGEI